MKNVIFGNKCLITLEKLHFDDVPYGFELQLSECIAAPWILFTNRACVCLSKRLVLR